MASHIRPKIPSDSPPPLTFEKSSFKGPDSPPHSNLHSLISGIREKTIDGQSLFLPKSSPLLPRPSVYDYKSNNFLKRISQQDFESLTQQMKDRGRTLTEEELQAFQKGKWHHRIFADHEWPLLALQAYLNGRLDNDTMCKLFLYDACMQQHNTDCQVNPEIPTPVAHQLYSDSGCLNESVKKTLRAATQYYLDESQFEIFCAKLQKLPPEKTQFFTLYRSMDEILCAILIGDELINLQEEEELKLRWPLGAIDFRPNFVNGKWWTTQFIATPQFIHLMQQTKHPDNTVFPEPHLGFSETEAMDLDSRVVSIPCPLIKLPEKIHGKQSSDLSTYGHDMIYHVTIEMANDHRPVWIAFASYMQKHAQEFNISESVLDDVWDRDCSNYVTSREDYAPANFWNSLGLHLEYCTEKNEKIITDCFIKFYNEEISKPNSLISKFGLTPESLKISKNLEFKSLAESKNKRLQKLDNCISRGIS